MEEQANRLREQGAILETIRQGRPAYRQTITNAFATAFFSCVFAGVPVGIFWSTIDYLAKHAHRLSISFMTILTWIAGIIAFSLAPAWLASRGRASFCSLSALGVILTLAMIGGASWSYWAYFFLATGAVCLYFLREQEKNYYRKFDEEELRKRGHDPKDFNLS